MSYSLEYTCEVLNKNLVPFENTIINNAIPMPVVSFEDFESTSQKWLNITNENKHKIDNLSLQDLEDLKIFGPDGKVGKENLNFYPAKSVGKLTSLRGSGSGTMIGENIILTAGHVVHPGGTKNINDVYPILRFQPSYPVHSKWYPIKKVFIHQFWVEGKVYSADLAICVTYDKMDIDSYWGLETFAGRTKYGWSIKGYPGEAPFDGESLYSDGGPRTDEPFRGNLSFEVQAVDHIDLTPGCSGGPWMLNGKYKKGNVLIEGKDPHRNRPYLINGINSFMYEAHPGIMISPYFGNYAEPFFVDTLAKIL